MAGNAPIIKKVKKVSGHGHHGGAWKVAYADFVTAMMAFFLLMWLLNATSEDQKKGIADFFDSRIPLIQSSGGGQGALRGDSINAVEDKPTNGAGAGAKADQSSDSKEAADAAAKDAAESKALQDIDSALRAMSGESEAADEMMSHIRTRLTPDGLVIEVFDTDGAPLFATGSAEPTPLLRGLMGMVASVATLVTNEVAVTGHTDAAPFDRGGDNGNWALSSERAHAARRLMAENGLADARVRGVTGRAASAPMVQDPLDIRNRRIEVTLLRSSPTR